MNIKPQPGPQTQFLSCEADIAIYGGAAGAGKTFALTIDPLRNIQHKNFGCVTFRRTYPELTGVGGICEEAKEIYPYVGGTPKNDYTEWTFRSGARIEFSHLQHEKHIETHRSRQYDQINFDEMTTFSAKQFWFMFSRNRGKAPVKSYIRGGTNPDPDSFVAELIAWWLDDSGYPIKDRSGVLRYFVRIGDDLKWSDDINDLDPELMPTSITFIPGTLEDNKILMKNDPKYKGKLLAMTTVERERYLYGNWRIRPAAGLYFRRDMFEVVEAAPVGLRMCRAWDRAASEPSTAYPDPDRTAGPKLGTDDNGIYYILDLVHGAWNADKVNTTMQNVASQDGSNVKIAIFQDPGQAGKWESQHTVRLLDGYDIEVINASTTGGKIKFASPFASQCQAGNVKVVRGPWNDILFNETGNFPDGKHDDIVDGLSLAHKVLSEPEAFLIF